MPLPRSPRAVITGAGGGFGRALAIELAKRNAHLVVSDINESAARETAELVRAGGAGSARAVRCDVTRLDDVQALASTCDGAVDLVVNNAGVSTGGLVGDIPIDDWRWVENRSTRRARGCSTRRAASPGPSPRRDIAA